jgi:hypothetical protein
LNAVPVSRFFVDSHLINSTTQRESLQQIPMLRALKPHHRLPHIDGFPQEVAMPVRGEGPLAAL